MRKKREQIFIGKRKKNKNSTTQAQKCAYIVEMNE